MTAVDWLEKQLTDAPYIHFGDLFEQAKEMEKQMVIDIVEKSRATGLTAEYLLLTYGSKIGNSLEWNGEVTQGNDENFKQFSLYEHKETIATSDTPTSSQTEISDEEIYKASFTQPSPLWHQGFTDGAKWYREQLKKKL